MLSQCPVKDVETNFWAEKYLLGLRWGGDKLFKLALEFTIFKKSIYQNWNGTEFVFLNSCDSSEEFLFVARVELKTEKQLCYNLVVFDFWNQKFICYLIDDYVFKRKDNTHQQQSIRKILKLRFCVLKIRKI